MDNDNDEQEKLAVNELKRRFNEHPDLYEGVNLFYRFLKARDFNVDNAERMLKEHLEARKNFGLENLSEWKPPEVLAKYVAFNKLGQNKDGCVVRYIPSGNIDWIGIYASCKIDVFQRFLVQMFEGDLESLRIYSEKTGKTADKCVYIHNVENFSFVQATDKSVVLNSVSLLNLYANHYPETMKTAFVINASTYFYLLFSVLKKFLPSTIINKIKVYSDDSWKEDLPKFIDPEILPAFLGGKRTDPDGNPLCNTFINHGGTIPQEFYIHRSKRTLAGLPDVQQLTLSRASFHEIFLEVTEPDCYLEWEFETESRDIGFGLYYQDSEENKLEIIPIQRINTDEYSETGIYKCDEVGTYIAVFDNTYSILRKKGIFYKIKVVKPQEAEFQVTN